MIVLQWYKKNYTLNALCSTLKKGFTLIEVMVATAILSMGVLMVYESLMISLDAHGYCFHYLNVAPLMDEKIWDVQDKLSRFGEPYSGDTSGTWSVKGKDIAWGLKYSSIQKNIQAEYREHLYQIMLDLSWQEGRRSANLSRAAYAIYKEK